VVVPAWPRGLNVARLRLFEGEAEGEGGAFSYFAGDGQAAGVFVDDAFGHGEAEAGTAFFAGVIGVEDFFEGVGGDAFSGVDDINDGCPVLLRGAENELAACGHGLEAVDHEVENGLLDELGVDVGDEGFLGRLESQPRLLESGLGGEEIDEFFEERVEIGGMAVELDLAGVAEEVF